MPETKPLYVRLPSADADRLDAVATATGKSKRHLVSEAVRGHLDGDELTVGWIALRENPGEVMTLAEAAAFLRLDESTVEQSAKQGELPGRCIAGEWRFAHLALLAWLGVSELRPTGE
jgi:hypothetical protein